MKKMLLALLTGLAAGVAGAEVVKFLEYVEVPYGAYFDTGIVPTDHETEITFSCENLNGGWIFGTKDGVNYYEFSMNNNYWRWGLNGSSRQGSSIANYLFNQSEGKHTVVYRQHGKGNLIIDGDVAESVSAATVKTTASATLLLGNASANASAANFTGRIYAVKMRDADGNLACDLVPCKVVEETSGAEDIGFYDRVTGGYIWNKVPAKPVTAGPDLAERLIVTGTPFEAGSDCHDVWYGVKDGLKQDAEVELSAPATFDFGPWVRATCTGWKSYTYDAATDVWSELDSGTETTIVYVHGSQPTKVVWQWSLETLLPTPEGAAIRYVAPNGLDANGGTSWNDAFASPYVAVQNANAGDVILVAPGTYHGVEQLYIGSRDYLTCIRLDKAVSVIGIGGAKKTVVDATYNIPRNGCYMTADGAFLSGFTFKNSGYFNKARNVGIQATAGTVSNCAFHCRAEWSRGLIDLDSSTYPVRAYDLEILYSKCLETVGESQYIVWIHGAKGVEVDGFKAVGIHLTGNNVNSLVKFEGGAAATPNIMRNALIADNVIGLEVNGNRGHAVELTGTARLVNSTIVNNRIYSSNAKGGVSVGGSGTPVENCIIDGNFCASSPYGDIANNSNVKYVFNTFCNQLDVSGANVNSNLNGTVDFVDAAHGDYRLNGTSICIDAGTTNRTAVGETDLAGAPRLSGEGVDLGCYEYQQTGALTAGFTVTATGGEPGEPLMISFAGTAVGGEGDVSVVWDFGDGTTSTEWPNASHAYAMSGKYDVTLTVTRGDESVTRTVEGAAVALPAVCYVKEGAGAGTYPYDTWAKATGDIKTALSVGSPKVLVGPGTYTLTHSRAEHFISLDRKVELVSSEGPEATVIDSPGPHVWCHRHFTISDAGAVLSGFTLTGGYTDYNFCYRYAAVLQMTAGLVTNCVVRDTGTLSRANAIDLSGTAKAVDCEFDGRGCLTSNGTGFQGGVYLYGNALVDRCRIHGYSIAGAYDTGTNLQGPVMLNENAELRNSLVYCCTNGTTANVKYGGVVQVINGTIANCTIADNYCGGTGAVKFFPSSATAATKGTIVNSIVVNNTALMDDGTGAQNDIYAQTAGATVSHCCAGSFGGVAGGVDETNTINNPNFSTEEGEAYHLSSLSKACLDVAEEKPWMSGSLDCDGNPRIDVNEKHGKPDLGCFEFVYPDGPEPLSATLDVFGGVDRAPVNARFEATVVGGGDEHTCTWDFGDGKVDATSGEIVSHLYETPGTYTVTLTVKSGDESVVVTGSVTVVPQTCFVSANGSGTVPYDTWEKAATNVLDAIGLNPKTVVVDDGVYYVSGEGVVLATDIELRSRNGADATTIRGTMNYDQKTQKYDSARLFWLNNADAVIDGITFEYGHTSIQGDAVCGKVEAGTLRNSVITNALPAYRSPVLSVRGGNSKVVDCVIDLKPGRLEKNQPNSNADGTDFFSVTIANGGLVDSCVIKNAAYENQGGQNANHKAAVHVHPGGTLRNSLVYGNRITQKGLIGKDPSTGNTYGTRSGAVVLWGDATVENCTIADNLIWHDGGLTIVPDDIAKSHTLYNPIARNNVVWGNVATNRETGASYRCDIRDIYAAKEDDGYLAEPRVSTTCALELTAPNDKGNVSADPLFKRKRGVPCQFGSSSPCYDTAAKLGWMDENAVDLLGNARIFSTGPDMGCFESRSGGLLLRVK